jgi:hypothetical protein
MKMFYKKDNCFVEVYNFFEDRTALIFSPSTAGRQNGNGWEKVKVGQLIPENYYDANSDAFISESTRTKIKKRLTLTRAEWTCTDGLIYNNCDEAIAHERVLMKKENENNAES